MKTPPSQARSTTAAPKLPKNKKALATIIENHAEREHTRILPKLTIYRLASLYLRGYRSFRRLDTVRGIVEASPYILSEDGVRRYQSQGLLKIINDNASRIASMDARASVGRNGDTLSSIRERSVAQVILDSVTDEKLLERAVEQMSWLVCTHGMAGILADVQQHASLGLTAKPEVVHPRELMPWPSLGEDHTQDRGRMRRRMIPMHQLVEIYGTSIKNHKMKMRRYESEIGEQPQDPTDGSTDSHMHDWPTPHGGAGTTDSSNMEHEYVLVNELWTDGIAGTVGEYAVTSGEYIFEHQDLHSSEVYHPLQLARFIDDGTWHGLGLFGLLFSIHREMEDLQQRMFENIRDLDQHETLIAPAAQVPQDPTIVNIGEKYKMIGLQVDVLDSTFNPFSLKPNNAGDLPGRTSTYASQIMEGLNPLDDIIRDKGRIDSAEAMEILQEEARQKHTSALRGMNRALGGYHRSVLTQALRKMSRTPTKIHLTTLSPELAGLVIDSDRDEVQIAADHNPIPSISHLTFDVRSVIPRNRSGSKNAAMATLKMTGDWDGFVLRSILEDFEVDSYVEDYKAAYSMISRHILQIYNDGNTPGKVVATPTAAKPQVQIRVLHAFMAGPVYDRASTAVKNAFQQYMQTLKLYSGNVLDGPPATPDDYAMAADAANNPQRRSPV